MKFDNVFDEGYVAKLPIKGKGEESPLKAARASLVQDEYQAIQTLVKQRVEQLNDPRHLHLQAPAQSVDCPITVADNQFMQRLHQRTRATSRAGIASEVLLLSDQWRFDQVAVLVKEVDFAGWSLVAAVDQLAASAMTYGEQVRLVESANQPQWSIPGRLCFVDSFPDAYSGLIEIRIGFDIRSTV